MFWQNLFFLFVIIVLWMHTYKGRCFHFRGKKYCEMVLKINWSVKTPLHRPRKWTIESLSRVDSSVHFIYHDPSDLGSLILIRIISKERTPIKHGDNFNNRHEGTILGNGASYAHALSPVERVLGDFLWDQGLMNLIISRQKNYFVT